MQKLVKHTQSSPGKLKIQVSNASYPYTEKPHQLYTNEAL